MKLYHYRPIESAIKEIRDGTFHFASRNELNDPVEGYVRVFWQGDKAAWEGMLRNYICSLNQAITLYQLQGDEEMLRHRTLAVDLHHFDNVPLGKILKDLGDKFLEDEEVQKISAFYGNNRLKVDAGELCIILYFIHNRAMSICIQKSKKCGTISNEEADSLLKGISSFRDIPFPFEQMENKLLDLNHRAIITKAAESIIEDMCEIGFVRYGFEDESFLCGPRKDEDVKDTITHARQKRNWLIVAVDFPRIYVEQLKDLIYPESYVVCFSGKNNNSVMWGNYADRHRGVCLIYEIGDKNSLTVRGDHAYNLEAKPVNYGGDIIERNFFESFGRLNYTQIRMWLTGTEGLSSAYEAIKSEDEWRQNYWNAYEAKTYKKLKAWEYENEYRLAITNTFYNFSQPESRNLKYDPKCLIGVIFGINTAEYDKWQIMKALREHVDDYENFIFYQAEYDEEGQTIAIRDKSLWRIE